MTGRKARNIQDITYAVVTEPIHVMTPLENNHSTSQFFGQRLRR